MNLVMIGCVVIPLRTNSFIKYAQIEVLGLIGHAISLCIGWGICHPQP